MDLSIMNEIEKGDIKPIYLLYGEEDFLFEQIIGKLKESLVAPEWQDFNYTNVDLLKIPLEVAVEETETYPFGAGKRLVVARNAYIFTAANIRHQVEHNLDSLVEYLEHPTDFSVLVFIVPYEKLDERKKIVKQISKMGRVLEAKPLNHDEWRSWVRRRVKEKGIQLEEQGMNLLFLYLPNNLRILESELDKLALFALDKPDGQITIHELERLVSRTVEGDVFALVDKVVRKDFHGAFEIYQELMKQNEEPIRILTLLARQVRIIVQAKVLSSQGYSQKQIATQLKLHPYPVKLALEQGKGFKENELLQFLDNIAEADYLIKTGQKDKRLALEMILFGFQSTQNK